MKEETKDAKKDEDEDSFMLIPHNRISLYFLELLSFLLYDVLSLLFNHHRK
jgi:hypothetical protein